MIQVILGAVVVFFILVLKSTYNARIIAAVALIGLLVWFKMSQKRK
jgi:hypothetical protein